VVEPLQSLLRGGDRPEWDEDPDGKLSKVRSYRSVRNGTEVQFEIVGLATYSCVQKIWLVDYFRTLVCMPYRYVCRSINNVVKAFGHTVIRSIRIELRDVCTLLDYSISLRYIVPLIPSAFHHVREFATMGHKTGTISGNPKPDVSVYK
jgi:hypothetical protein